MNKDDKLRSVAGTDTGMRVPDGFFDDIYRQTAAILPEKEMEAVAAPLSTWQRIKPYVYLAAMFCGIWLMMKMFSDVSSSATRYSLENPPEAIAAAMVESPADDYMYETVMSQPEAIDIREDVIDAYSDFDALQQDLGIVLEDEYARIEISEAVGQPHH